MKILFTSDSINFNRYKLGAHDVDRAPKMTDTEVAQANLTRKLPEDFYVVTRETNYYTRSGKYRPKQKELYSVIYKQPVITIIKGDKNFRKEDCPRYYTTLPEGFELENNLCGTYMKKSNVKYALLNRFQCHIYVASGAILGLLISKLGKIKK